MDFYVITTMDTNLFTLPSELTRLFLVTIGDGLTINLFALTCRQLLRFVDEQKLYHPQNLKYGTALAVAARHGYDGILEWLTTYRKMGREDIEKVIHHTIIGGHITLFSWLPSKIPATIGHLKRGINVVMTEIANLGSDVPKEMALYLCINGHNYGASYPIEEFSGQELGMIGFHIVLHRITRLASQNRTKELAKILAWYKRHNILFFRYLFSQLEKDWAPHLGPAVLVTLLGAVVQEIGIHAACRLAEDYAHSMVIDAIRSLRESLGTFEHQHSAVDTDSG